MKKQILMIEDERGLLLSVGDRLINEGYAFTGAANGNEGLKKVVSGTWDLVILDLMLPGPSGFDIVRSARGQGLACPFLILSARASLSDRVSGLRLGANDYLVKPFDMDELVARTEVQLRQTGGPGADPSHTQAIDFGREDYCFGPFRLSFKTVKLLRDNLPIALSNQEFRLLSLLTKHAGEVLPMDLLLSLAWGYQAEVTSRTLYVHIAWLRKKLTTDDRPDGYIRTINRVGYLFVQD
jgi:two-component system alkaline phosphatase synthesis response regulator PhoP